MVELWDRSPRPRRFARWPRRSTASTGLFLNAAVATHTYGRTQDGWEQTLQVNALSAALIALLTLPRLAPSSSVSIPCVVIFAERAAEDLLARLDDQADSEAHAAPGWSTEHGSRSLVAAGPECQKLQETVWAETVAILR